MKSLKYLLVLAFSFCCIKLYGQHIGKVIKAEKKYAEYGYAQASEILLDLVKKGHTYAEVYQKLADAYYFNNNMKDAAHWYKALMKISVQSEMDPVYFFRYGQALRSVKQYNESDVYMKKYAEATGSEFISVFEFLGKIEEPVEDYVITNLDINSPYSDFGNAVVNDQLIFTSSRGEGKVHGWNGQPFYNLYEYSFNEGDSLKNDVKPIKGDVNTRLHESSATISKDGKVMYFTRNNYSMQKSKRIKGNSNTLGIYKAELQYGKWINVQPLPFNSDQYNVSHPSLSHDGRVLYFASDMPGTLGGSDIYMVEIKTDGSYGIPKNLGRDINTPQTETFPFISKKGDLYFSSNGHVGLGGLDVFKVGKETMRQIMMSDTLGMVSAEPNKTVIKPKKDIVNMTPINSTGDDFAFYIDDKTLKGYFSSNREGGKGDDDIYSFEIRKCRSGIKGVVRDFDNGEVLPGALVVLYNEQGKELKKERVKENGQFFFTDIDCSANYQLIGSKERYVSDSATLFTVKGNQNEADLILEQEFVVEEEKIMIKVNTIYFDFNAHAIRPDAAKELDKVVEAMKKYPSIMIEAGSHTDSRGGVVYNERLSGRRAKSAADYIISRGIEPSRISSKGYGKSMPKIDCGAKCSEDDHQLNRRTEFVVLNKDDFAIVDSSEDIETTDASEDEDTD
jgi:outer membrane protein OmpA-like peptidoglycan-associated protein/tetratricopeptide (TPR) repeat protein